MIASLELLQLISILEIIKQDFSMKHAVILLIGIVISGYVNAQCLEDLKWKNRVVVINGSQSSNRKQSEKQIKLLKDAKAGLADRKIVAFRYENIKLEPLKLLNESVSIKSISIDNLRDFKEDFQFILIGLDGGIKISTQDIMTSEKLFSIIDRMPMRRSEIGG